MKKNRSQTFGSSRVVKWQGYSLGLSDEEVFALFVAKFGYEPKEIKRTNGCILVGPKRKIRDNVPFN